MAGRLGAKARQLAAGHARYMCFCLDCDDFERQIARTEAAGTGSTSGGVDLAALLNNQLDKINDVVELQWEVIDNELRGQSRLPAPDKGSLQNLLDEVNLLKDFVAANTEAFREVIAEADRRCGTSLAVWFRPRVESAQFRQRDCDAVIKQVVRLLNTKPQGGPGVAASEAQSSPAQAPKLIPQRSKSILLAAAPGPLTNAVAKAKNCYSDMRGLYFRLRTAPKDRKLKVDPKTPLAIERTLLRWIRSAIILSSLSVLLSSISDPAAQVNGLLLGLVSLLFVFWPLIGYLKRSMDVAQAVPKQPKVDKSMAIVLGVSLSATLTAALIVEGIKHL